MHRTNNTFVMIAAISIAIMLTPAYSATLQAYTDATVFATLTQDMTLITFDNSGVNAGEYASFNTSAGFTTSGVQFIGYLSYMGGYYAGLGWGINNGHDWGTNATFRGPGGPNQHLRLFLPNGVTAIGMNLMTADYNDVAGGSITVTPFGMASFAPFTTTAWNPSQGSSPNASHATPTWWGFTSDDPISYIDISSSNTGYLVLDNLQIGSKATQQMPDPPEVPEASTMILIGTGLGAFSLLRRFGLTHTA